MAHLVALDAKEHQQVYIDTQCAELESAHLNMVPVVVSEFLKLAVQYPIALTKNKDTGRFTCIALFGFNTGENLYLKDDRWDSLYIPLQIQRQPFFLGDDKGEYIICIDSEHKSINSQKNNTPQNHINQHAKAIFTEEGKATDFLEHIKSVLAELLNNESHTQLFIQSLLDLKLVQPMQLDITFANGESTKVEGIYTINEENLNTLDKDSVFALHQQEFLSPIYTMLTSLGHIYSLVERKNALLKSL